MLAIIGGSGLTQLANLNITHREIVRTPYGEPSGPLSFGRIHATPLMFVARHGHGHTIAPHEVNYRANVWALREKSATEILSIASVGGIRPEFGPGQIVIPDQVIDYTWGRKSTFFESGEPPRHVDFTEPYTPALRLRLLAAARTCGQSVHDFGVYAVTQGPRLESAAEINRLERDGADLVGMTGMPEAALARELDMQYALIAVVVNHAAGRGDSRRDVRLAETGETLGPMIERVHRIIEALVSP